MSLGERVVILADHASVPIASKVHKILSKRLNKKGVLMPFSEDHLYLNRFKNNEVEVQIKTNVRKKDVFLIKSFNVVEKRWGKKKDVSLICDPNAGYAELLAINDALKRASAKEIANVILYMPYLRQDRKDKPRVPITAKQKAKAKEASGATRILTIDPHFKQIQGFYEIPFDDLKSSIIFADYFQSNFKNLKKEFVVASPDIGGGERAEDLAKILGLPLVINYKRRKDGNIKIRGILKMDEVDLKGKSIIIYDDIVDSGGSLIESTHLLREEGVKNIYACCTHAVLSGDAKETLKKNEINLVTTNSILVPDKEKYPNISVVSLHFLTAMAIYAIYSGSSLSDLFHYKKYVELKKKYDIQ